MTLPLPLAAWAARNKIEAGAMAELMNLLGIAERKVATSPDTSSEARVQSVVRLEAARLGVWLSRNNVGVLQDVNKRPVRYGLANESKAQNEVLKSSDLIGIKPVEITSEMVGSVIGQFVAREVKHEGWAWGEDVARETAQLAFLSLITSHGGDAKFATGEGSFG